MIKSLKLVLVEVSKVSDVSHSQRRGQFNYNIRPHGGNERARYQSTQPIDML